MSTTTAPKKTDATTFPTRNNIPAENLTLIDRHETYAHNDPNSAYPNNEFIDGLIPFLQSID